MKKKNFSGLNSNHVNLTSRLAGLLIDLFNRIRISFGKSSSVRKPAWFTGQLPVIQRVKGRFSPAANRFLRALPAVTVMMILATLVVFLTIGPGSAIGVLMPVAAADTTKESGKASEILTSSRFESDYHDYLVINRGQDLVLPDEDYLTGKTDLPAETSPSAEPSQTTATVQPAATPVPTITPVPVPTTVPIETDANGVVREVVPVTDFTPDLTDYYVKAYTANVRALPGTDADIVASVVMGDKVVRTG